MMNKVMASLMLLSMGGLSLAAEGAGPIHLAPGPHLFIDNHLIASESNLVRLINHPSRLPEPIVTAPGDKNFQPYVSVVQDPETKRFKIWYGVPANPPQNNPSHLAYMESEDGINWIRPPRILKDPGGIPIRFGASVIDMGPNYHDPATRYKFGWYWGEVTDPPTGGLMIATSPDGLHWTPIVSDPPVLPHTHDINGIYWDPIRKRYMATISTLNRVPGWKTRRRLPYMTVSDDLINWSEPWQIIPPDEKDEGEFQYYAMDGYLRRGDLIIGLAKVLRDDLSPEPGGEPTGIGYTTLAWTRDGVHWERDRKPFMDRNPTTGTWDRAMTWGDSQLLVGDEVYIYYGGYAGGHKTDRFNTRQIGLARMPRDRYIAREAARDAEAMLRTPMISLAGDSITINANIAGEMHVRLLDVQGKPIEGFDWADGKPIRGDSTRHPLRFSRPISSVADQPVSLEFKWRDGRLYAFDLTEAGTVGEK